MLLNSSRQMFARPCRAAYVGPVAGLVGGRRPAEATAKGCRGPGVEIAVDRFETAGEVLGVPENEAVVQQGERLERPSPTRSACGVNCEASAESRLSRNGSGKRAEEEPIDAAPAGAGAVPVVLLRSRRPGVTWTPGLRANCWTDGPPIAGRAGRWPARSRRGPTRRRAGGGSVARAGGCRRRSAALAGRRSRRWR